MEMHNKVTNMARTSIDKSRYIGPAEGTELILARSRAAFPRKLIIEERNSGSSRQNKKRKSKYSKIWCEGSKLEKREQVKVRY